MLNSLRVVNFHNNIKPLDIKSNVKSVKLCMKQGDILKSNIIVFPKNTLYGKSLSNFIYNKTICKEISDAFNIIFKKSESIESYIVIHSIKYSNNRIREGISLIYKGEEIFFLEDDKVIYFDINGIKTALINCDFKSSVEYITNASKVGCKMVILPQYEEFTVTTYEKTLSILKGLSLHYSMAITYNSGSIGDSSGLHNYRGFSFNIENGVVLSNICINSKHINSDGLYSSSDYDFDFIEDKKTIEDSAISLISETSKDNILRGIHKNPFSEYYKIYDNKFLLSIFDMQVEALAKRIKNTGIHNVVLAVSGGLDSTMAMLVCVKAMDCLGFDRENLKAVTLPGLGTSGQTYKNACALIRSQNVKFMEISITNAVLNHFMDIGHNENNKDVVYENSQARERTQIMLDLANKHNAIYIGTSDLSEDALGFCTFGGDHLAGFNINSCLTKTMIRQMIKMLIDNNVFLSINHTLTSILETPISPELLPSENGTIVQKTENILGDYILHDFFLFYLLKYNLSFEKICIYAMQAFNDTYSKEFVKEKLKLFVTKFFGNQFKRNCQPESVAITDINLLYNKFMFSSDIDLSTIIREIENI